LAGLLGRVAGMRDAERAAMGQAARERVEGKAPKRAFGEGLLEMLSR
jgi:hypothetical protein